ncbi:MAG: hypothetical protein DLM55_07470 [Acidimicrobiales bacterium]|nr:MAG: hypothetical protein DLM55_07470 [Acidimicrobiales bacterium]
MAQPVSNSPVSNSESAAFDLAGPIDRAIDEAEHGKVIYLHRRQQQKVAVMPAELAHEALAALEDANDVATMAAADGEPRRPFEDVARELGV